MMFMNGKDVDLHQVLWSRSRLGERQKGRELQADLFLVWSYAVATSRLDIGNLHYIDTVLSLGELTLVQLQ